MNMMLKIISAIHVAFYRITNGRMGGISRGVPTLLLTTVGRKSGNTRTTPLIYIREGHSYVVGAAKGGSPKNPGWYWNAKGDHPVTIQVMGNEMAVEVTEPTGPERDMLFEKLNNAFSGFSEYQRKATRVIPVLKFTPK